jgi:MFS family permease
LSRLPFFFFPFIDNVWLILALAALFLTLYRGGTPLWMEVLRLNLPEQRSQIFSRGLMAGYAEGVILAIAVGFLLDGDAQSWRWIFPLSALIGMGGVAFQARLSVPVDLQEAPRKVQKESLKQAIVAPWIESWQLMRDHSPFRRFQWGFMVAGFGLMIMFPAFPLYFDDVLGLSYTELTIALAVCKGLGFALTSPWWGHRLERMHIYRFSALAFFLVGLFALGLILASWNVLWIYLAYLIYGIGQAGSELVWHLGGTMFSKERDSAPFTSVNVVMVGLRGCLAPPLGTLLCLWFSPIIPLILGMGLCSLSALLMRRWSLLSLASSKD